jgi:protein tyrosine phosphatase
LVEVDVSECSRVKLPSGNFINANTIECSNLGCNSTFIACQAPLVHTFVSFWEMIWEQRSPVICMLTRLIEGEKTKADIYWPLEIDETRKFGPFRVTLKNRHNLQHIEIRTLILGFQEENRCVTQLHYTEWPDFGVPSSTNHIRDVLRFMQIYKAKGANESLNGPVIGHCSAGIGRIGTFIAAAFSLELLQKGFIPNLKEIVCRMRQQRCGMVQTLQQYLFISSIVKDSLEDLHPVASFPLLDKKAFCTDTVMDCDECDKSANLISIPCSP